MSILFWRDKPVEPSPEAKQALDHARDIRDRSEVVYATRKQLLEHNHFAERIRLIYEGTR